MKKNNGFTLIETLIVVFLIGIVMVAGGNMLFGIMKGASKVEVEREIKQNGEYALAIMERMIKNSKEVLECNSSYVTIKNIDNENTRFQVSSERIASSSGDSYDHHLYLTGDKVSVSDLVFICTTDPVGSLDEDDIRRVDINFTITPKGVTAGEVPPEMYAEINFQTSVSLRNFLR
jgi:prepilin-type N-terminal cleavage/methylation domain-containing protein